MIYLDMILSVPNAEIEIVPQADHLAYPIKHRMAKPRLSLWELYKIKKFLETGYDKLIEEQEKQPIQDSDRDTGGEVDTGGGNSGKDIVTVPTDMESDKR